MEVRVEDIIDKLKEIQLKKIRLIQEERRFLDLLERKLASDAEARRRQRDGSNPPALTLHQSLAEDDISVGSDVSYETGDEVYVKNNLGALAPSGRRANLKDRAAKVVATEDNRIYIKNYSGKESWRAAGNLRPLKRQEKARLRQGQDE